MDLVQYEQKIEDVQAQINQLRAELVNFRPQHTLKGREEIRSMMEMAIVKAGSQSVLAAIMGVSVPFISQVMKGHRAGYNLRAALIHYLRDTTGKDGLRS